MVKQKTKELALVNPNNKHRQCCWGLMPMDNVRECTAPVTDH